MIEWNLTTPMPTSGCIYKLEIRSKDWGLKKIGSIYLHDHGRVLHDAPARAELLDGTRSIERPRSPANPSHTEGETDRQTEIESVNSLSINSVAATRSLHLCPL